MGRQMNFNVAFMGVLIASGTLFMFHLYKDVDIGLARTITFTTLVVLEIVRVQIIRMSHNERFFSNSWLVAALALSLAMQLAVIYTALIHPLPHSPPQCGALGLYFGHRSGLGYTGQDDQIRS